MKKQITIDGENSDWYEKAIFILKESKKPYMPDNLFLYAEHIVENHLKKNPMPYVYKEMERKTAHKKKGNIMAQKIDKFFNISLIICGVGIIALAVAMFI
ncbi:hypothetical protein [Cellulosilyticum sp. I15G10I2]|uniref:hypothetical protein n=1 Tax=Cellulosilyticum sp. I15G10I2 TaxID=1892843 RepID=UPI00085CDCF6|nr:hypothetical protein [Cellulosilyticum sp. I15G10I2]